VKVAVIRKEIFSVIAEILTFGYHEYRILVGDRNTYVLLFQNSSWKLSRNMENSKRNWKCAFPSFFQIHSATLRESNSITVTTVSTILHFTLHENITVLMGICSTQSMRNG